MFSSIIRNLLLITTVAVSIVTVASGWASKFHPKEYWFFSLLGLGFQAVFLVNLVLIFTWLLKRSKIILIPILAAVMVYPQLSLLYQIEKTNEIVLADSHKQEVSFMSFNVRLFDLYDWSHNQLTRQKILELIASEKPEIMCLQEFYSSQRGNFDNESALLDMSHIDYVHIEYPLNLYGSDNYGIGTFSSHPIVGRGVLNFEEPTANNCIFTDILIGTDTIRVYNCHLQSVKLADSDYKFIEGLGKTAKEEEKIQRTRNILSRLKNAFIKRARQAEYISEHIAQSPHPVIVCGDFNDTPISYTYKVIAAGLKDAFIESGSGFGSTYAGPLPGLRIDYILHSKEIVSHDFEILKVKLSDHYPIQTKFAINP